jgi:hypothetical protein
MDSADSNFIEKEIGQKLAVQTNLLSNWANFPSIYLLLNKIIN